ncbi:hypothetical protein L1987_05598 [Smallanthus sonchifolius]|uniref:Uncharacterized protein n=1 Tax=Smallanthus sonchifolius TaxID=185202 RepID=A0ACB9JW82_9ASTR|nr:hypothetical protein L1987_05598 [Smallanthus sonchifolius]
MQEQRASEVAHQPHQPTSAAPVATTKATSGAILENAAASVSSALQSAREIHCDDDDDDDDDDELSGFGHCLPCYYRDFENEQSSFHISNSKLNIP